MKSWPTKKLGEMRKVWLVQWGCHAQNENECLRRSGINERVMDIISVRKDFDKIVEIAKDIYARKMLSFSEKVFLSNYFRGKKRKREFFGGTIPVFTHYQTDLYRNLMENTRKGLKNKKTQELLEKWKKYPQYVIVGHNPYLEICKVFNLVVYQNKTGHEVIEWNRPLVNGSFEKEKYEFEK